MRRSILSRGAVVLLVDAATLLALAELLPRFMLEGADAALATAALVGLLNALVWPVLARLALPLSVLTLGLAGLALNAALVTLAIDVVPGATVEGFWTGLVVTLGLAAITALVYALLAMDEDESWYRNVVRRQLRRRGARSESDVPGVVFLEIDGLAHDVLRRAMRDGSALRWPAGCGRAHTASNAGRPTGRPTRAPARRGFCTATTTTCPPFAGGRRIVAYPS
jgi:uncharacterized membrane protein YvlD (DUF360 family)